jgi:hypothetical protein
MMISSIQRKSLSRPADSFEVIDNLYDLLKLIVVWTELRQDMRASRP